METIRPLAARCRLIIPNMEEEENLREIIWKKIRVPNSVALMTLSHCQEDSEMFKKTA